MNIIRRKNINKFNNNAEYGIYSVPIILFRRQAEVTVTHSQRRILESEPAEANLKGGGERRGWISETHSPPRDSILPFPLNTFISLCGVYKEREGSRTHIKG